MTINDATNPIGIFDSGIGGLTVAQAIVNALPRENIVYFGDTAHLPYGDKSTASIQAYAIKIVDLLLKQQCKLILIACNSASAAAYDLVKEYIASKALVMNVIDPVIYHLQEKFVTRRVGLIGTRQTVNSLIYAKKIAALKLDIQLSCAATNLLASAIEEFGNHHIIDDLLKVYLAHPELQEIDALLLACTHYPIIKDKIISHYQKPIEIIDSSEIVAQAVHQKLAARQLLNNNGVSQKHFFVSDFTENFADKAKLFFNEEIKLEHYPLWD